MMKKSLLASAAVLISLVSFSRPAGKVVFFGVDGLASWCVEKALDSIPERIPNIRRLMDEGCWTLDKRAVYQTSSAINWATIFMGVPTEMHGYYKWNSRKSGFEPYARTYRGMPATLLTLLHEQRPDAVSSCIYDWDGIGYVIDSLSATRHCLVPYEPESFPVQEYARKYALPELGAEIPDFFFFYTVDVDETGHEYGWGSKEYYDAMARTDEALGLVLDAIDRSPLASEISFMLSSDHGGGGKAYKKHGGNDIRDFRTPLLLRGSGFPAGGVINTPVMQYDLTAILADLLGLEQPFEWRGRSDFGIWMPDKICKHPAWPKGKGVQGMDIYGNYLLQGHNRGMLSIYRFDGKSIEPLGEFDMDSYHHDNHCNVLSFGPDFWNAKDSLPLLYVSQCSRKMIEKYKDVCYVERVASDFKSSKKVQTICYDDVNGDFGYALQWVVDAPNRMLYGYGNTTYDKDVEGNRHRIIKFALPSPKKKMVVLRPEDALENYCIEDYGYSFATIGQGLYVRDGLLYMPTGFGTVEYPSYLYVWDLVNKKMVRSVKLRGLTTGEPEDISWYDGSLIMSGLHGIFRLPF